MTASAALLPGTEVLVDTDRTCRQLPMRGIRATVLNTWHDKHTQHDYVIVCLEGHAHSADCVWKCRQPLLRTDEVITIPAQATS